MLFVLVSQIVAVVLLREHCCVNSVKGGNDFVFWVLMCSKNTAIRLL